MHQQEQHLLELELLQGKFATSRASDRPRLMAEAAALRRKAAAAAVAEVPVVEDYDESSFAISGSVRSWVQFGNGCAVVSQSSALSAVCGSPGSWAEGA